MIQAAYFKNYFSFQKKKFVLLLGFIIIGILTIPGPYFFPRADLDASGMIGIYISQLRHFQIGLNTVSQFGPLAFLYAPVFIDPSLWFPAMLYRLGSHSLFLFSIGFLLAKSSVTWKKQLLVFPIILALSYVNDLNGTNEYESIFSLVILLYMISVNKIGTKYEIPLLLLVSFLLSVDSFMKFNDAVASLSILAIFSIISIGTKKFRRALLAGTSYISFLVFLWIVSGQDLTNLPTWFTNNMQFTQGYTYGQAIDGSKILLFEGIIGIAFIIILSAYSFIKKIKDLSVFILLNIVLLFITFKHGYVRQDGHVLLFFFYYGLFFLLSHIIYKDESNKTKHRNKLTIKATLLGLSILFSITIVTFSPSVITSATSQAPFMYESVLPLMFDKSYQDRMIEDGKTFSKNHYKLDNETINYIGNKTLDILPWDIGLPWVYDFNWSPRPMWWSFQVFSPQIDKLNAHHFLDEKEVPQTVLYAYKSTDYRYPLFDEPLTFQALLQNYEYVHTSGEFMLLAHNSKPHTWKVEQDLGIVKGELGKPIKIPKYVSGYEFADIDLKFSSLGKLMNTVYKPSLASIMFKFSDNTYSQEFRFIPGASVDGVFVSQYVGNVHDLQSIFLGKITPDIDEIIISADEPTHYENTIQVKFVGIPTQIFIQVNNDTKMPEWRSLKLIQGGMMAIDTIGNTQYAKQGNIINVSNDFGEFVPIRGWAVDNLAKDGTVKTFLVFQDENKQIILPTKKETRPDLVDVYGINSYVDGGWGTVLDTKEFGHECYTLSLYVTRSNNQEYFKIDGGRSICFR
jgi:hypothetical protein